MTIQTESVKLFDRRVEKKDEFILRARLERAARLKALREASGLTAAQFAKEGGITEATQFNYERGTRIPDADYLENLHVYLAIDIGELVTGVPRALRSKGYDAQTTGLADRYQQLPKLLRKTVDDVLALAHFAYQERKAYHQEAALDDAPAKAPPVKRKKSP